MQIQSKSHFFRWAFLIRAFYCNSNFSVSYNDVFVVTFPSYSLLFIALFDCNILTLKLWCAIENVMEFAHLDSSSLSLSLLLSLSSLKTPQYYHCHGVALLIRYSRNKCCHAHVWMLSTKGGAILRDNRFLPSWNRVVVQGKDDYWLFSWYDVKSAGLNKLCYTCYRAP